MKPHRVVTNGRIQWVCVGPVGTIRARTRSECCRRVMVQVFAHRRVIAAMAALGSQVASAIWRFGVSVQETARALSKLKRDVAAGSNNNESSPAEVLVSGAGGPGASPGLASH